MKIIYVSRTGNVRTFIEKLGIEAEEATAHLTCDVPYVFVTYTDGYGDVPMEAEDFLSTNGDYIQGVIVSGDKGYDTAYCVAGDTIANDYNVPCLYKFENDGTEEDVAQVKSILEQLG